MNTDNQIGHLLKSAIGITEDLEPLDSIKNPIIAAGCGFALGGLGLGLYLRSWKDFLIPWSMMVAIALFGTVTGEALLILTPVFWGFYGYRRAKASNAKLNAGRVTGKILEVTIVSNPRSYDAVLLPNSAAPTVASRLRRLDDLFDEGILSKAEHDTKRAQLLNNL